MRSLLFVLLVLIAKPGFATIRMSAADGNWNSASTWQDGILPVTGDSIIIRAGDVVTITQTIDFSSGSSSQLLISDSGTVVLNNGKRLKLSVGSAVYLVGYTSAISATGGGNSAFIDIGGVTVWAAGSTNTTGPVCFPSGISWCNGVVLPVIYSYWRLVSTPIGVMCEWGTSSEMNSDYFVIERTEDLITFREIGRVNASGVSYIPLNYQFFDTDINDGEKYYRIRQIDRNGDSYLTKTLSTRTGSGKMISVYPNPAREELFINLGYQQYNRVPVQVTILNAYGSVAGSFILNGPGTHKILLRDTFSSGVYVVQTDFGYTVQAVRIIIR
ncbi:MAG: T9SS type A sorting domain-containing protein [Bacteroidia bacterium]|nr:T9SS type A sorting domain-containing protein [Bacteroidia bacterium]